MTVLASCRAGRALVAAVLLALALTLGGCDMEGAPPRAASAPSTILITIDAIRPDVLSPYGGPVRLSRFERLVAQGVLFEDAATVCPMARPAATTVMTGVVPDRHGVRDNVTDRVGSDHVLLAELHRRAGRATAAFVASPFVSYGSGLSRGFELFDGPEASEVGPARHFPHVRSASEVVDHFAQWLATLPRERAFFAWLHWSDLHALTLPPGEPVPAVYAQTLLELDRALGRVIDAQRPGVPAPEIWLVGTHGVLLGETAAGESAFWLRRETLRVPLVRFHGAETGRRDERPVSLTDVGVELRRAAGEAVEGTTEGMLGRADAPALAQARQAWTWATDDQLAWPTLTAVEDGGVWRVWAWPEPAAPQPARPRERRLEEIQRSALVAAGVRVGRAGVEPRQDLASAPAERFVAELGLLRRQLAARQLAAAAATSRTLLDAHPQSLAALTDGLFVALAERRARDAAALAARLLELFPERPESLHWAGHAALAADQAPRAAALFEAAASLTRTVEGDLLYDVACARSRAGDIAEAVVALGQAIDAGYRDWEWIERDPDLTAARNDAAYLALMGQHGR